MRRRQLTGGATGDNGRCSTSPPISAAINSRVRRADLSIVERLGGFNSELGRRRDTCTVASLVAAWIDQRRPRLGKGFVHAVTMFTKHVHETAFDRHMRPGRGRSPVTTHRKNLNPATGHEKTRKCASLRGVRVVVFGSVGAVVHPTLPMIHHAPISRNFRQQSQVRFAIQRRTFGGLV